MRESKHTPGPWVVTPTYQGALSDRFKGVPFAITGANGFQPCLILGDGTNNRGTAEDNARLIGLAPKFLAACLAYVEAERNGGVSHADLRNIAHRKIFDAVEEWNR